MATPVQQMQSAKPQIDPETLEKWKKQAAEFEMQRHHQFPVVPILLCATLFLLLAVFYVFIVRPGNIHQNQICISLVLAVAGFYIVHRIIPNAQTQFKFKEGIDIHKPYSKKLVPEGLGLVVGVVYMIIIIISEAIYSQDAVKSMLVEYNAALHSICFMLFLGFSDDVLNLRWRYKLVLPAIATLPLLVAYHGVTNVIVPLPLRFLLGKSVELGLFYKLYMGLLAVFCCNAINIHAGINGLEAGQSFVISCSILIHNMIELNGTSEEPHLFSIFIILPFIGCTLALLKFNWFPASVFVGDTYTYFAGMTFAVAGILGHFSKTLMLFFAPQIINFLYSLPQLIGIYPIERHRLPKYNPDTGKLVPQPQHMNLLNLCLRITGPLTEEQTCVVLLLFQAFCCGLAFFIRYYVSRLFYS
eukprot:TRINITY_DN9202_c0_g1_i1.p1 TRINITY_DN9202_c0_g1~~TRINITY_DN9202_c0_g1_i1.p1  ORF type:complete len:415 (+),score=53.93 TRINITY_DN9202_c0_g1_i1:127-1371(+)